MPDTSTYLLGVLSYSIYVNASGKDITECGSIANVEKQLDHKSKVNFKILSPLLAVLKRFLKRSAP